MSLASTRGRSVSKAASEYCTVSWAASLPPVSGLLKVTGVGTVLLGVSLVGQSFWYGGPSKPPLIPIHRVSGSVPMPDGGKQLVSSASLCSPSLSLIAGRLFGLHAKPVELGSGEPQV